MEVTNIYLIQSKIRIQLEYNIQKMKILRINFFKKCKKNRKMAINLYRNWTYSAILKLGVTEKSYDFVTFWDIKTLLQEQFSSRNLSRFTNGYDKIIGRYLMKLHNIHYHYEITNTSTNAPLFTKNKGIKENGQQKHKSHFLDFL